MFTQPHPHNTLGWAYVCTATPTQYLWLGLRSHNHTHTIPMAGLTFSQPHPHNTDGWAYVHTTTPTQYQWLGIHSTQPHPQNICGWEYMFAQPHPHNLRVNLKTLNICCIVLCTRVCGRKLLPTVNSTHHYTKGICVLCSSGLYTEITCPQRGVWWGLHSCW